MMRGMSVHGAPAAQPIRAAGRLTRREMLATLAAIVAASRAPGAATAGPSPFPLHDVRLLDGPFLDAQKRDLDYLLSLQPDRMLHNFRVNAGLEPKAPVYGGWESEEPWVDIRCHGHTLGHYLSAASLDVRVDGRRAHEAARRLHRRRAAGLSDAPRERARLRVPRRRGAARERRGGPSVRRRALVHDAQDLRRPARCAPATPAAPRRSTS